MATDDFLPDDNSPPTPVEEIKPIQANEMVSEKPIERTPPITDNKGITFEMIRHAKICKPDLTLAQAAELFDCHIDNIRGHCRRNGTSWSLIIPGLKEFKTRRADVLADMQVSALKGITPDKIKKSTARECATIFGIMYDKERIERGQDAGETAINVLVAAMSRASGRMLNVQDAVLIEEEDHDLPPVKQQAPDEEDEENQ